MKGKVKVVDEKTYRGILMSKARVGDFIEVVGGLVEILHLSKQAFQGTDKVSDIDIRGGDGNHYRHPHISGYFRLV